MKICLVIKEAGKLKPHYSLDFDVPALPRAGDYISVQRPDEARPFGEDLLVDRVWWRLDHPSTEAGATVPATIGTLAEVMVECQPAVGPYSSDDWKTAADHAKSRGTPFATMEVSRFNIRQQEKKLEDF